MSRVRIALAAVLAAAALAVMAVPASASVPAAANTKYCKAMSSISDKLSDTSATSLSEGRSVLKKYANSLKSAAKNAPSSVSSATKTIASFYDALASGNASALKNAKNLSPAILKVSSYIASNCTGTR